MTADGLIAVATIAALSCAGLFYVSVYNSAQRLINMIPEFASNIAVLVRKRADLISKLISIVDAYGLHEQGTNNFAAAELSGSRSSASAGSIVARLASLRMAFPELKADGLYAALMQELANVETDIANRRERYNSTVRAYNTLITHFPNNFLLAPFGFRTKSFLSDQELSA